ncbi:MAG: DUF3649 domain-containing protein [Pseudomonadota bacterium]
MSVSKPTDNAARLSVFSRVVAASIGAYVLVNLGNLALSFLLPGEQYRALLLAMQTGFLIYTLAIIWVFSVRTATKAWLGLLAVAIPLIIIDGFFYLRGGA